MPEAQAFLATVASDSDTESWFVYLLPATDCSIFKIGFSCNPFHRIYSFNHRYFEQFDLSRSLLLEAESQAQARALEAALKAEFASSRGQCPTWVAREAGGHTEWFSAVCLVDAEERARALIGDEARVLSTFDFIRGEIERLSLPLESWAWQQAQHLEQAAVIGVGRQMRVSLARTLRDWLDACRYFEVVLFADDPEARQFVSKAARFI